MKKLSLFILATLFIIVSNAQAPQGISYQAVARNGVGQIIPSQNIGVRFSILDGSVTGTTVYQEMHTTITNNFGLFTLAIGRGTVVSGTFATVNWATGDKFLKVEIAPQGGINYLIQGTTQLLSVPYALYSEKTKLLAGNNTINIANGNTISGNYQAANNTVLVNGNTIAGNYQAGTAIGISGNTISGNYQPGVGINISGATISHNLVAGTGINIAGNTITATGNNNLWIPDPSGIHNMSGSVGIGTNSVSGSALTIQQVATGGFSGAMDITSNDIFHTVFRFRNTTVNQEWQMMVGGSGNTDQRPASIGIFNTRNLNWLFHGDANTNFAGIGSYTIDMPEPKSRLHVFNGDINIDQIGSGIILKSPNGQCWRVTIDNTGNLIRTAIACP